MTRILYDRDVVAQLTPSTTDDATALGGAVVNFTAWTARTGGSQITDLLDIGGNAVTTVVPEAGTYRLRFWGPDGYVASIYLQDPDGNRWLTFPSDIADRVTAPTMSSAEALAGTLTDPRLITPAVLKAAIQALAWSNTYTMPVWDGTGSQPTRPTGLPSTFVVTWRQASAPPVGPTFAHTGDEWEATS